MINFAPKIIPDHIRCIAVTAPAGNPPAKQLAEAMDFLQNTLQLKVKEFMPDRTPDTPDYLAGNAKARAEAFNRAVSDPEIDMILCARGGFGCVHILNDIDYAVLQARRLIVMGYSDITALHCAMLKNNAGIPVAGSNLIGLAAAAADKNSAASHLYALSDSTDVMQVKLPALKPAAATVTACAYAANLTVLTSLCGTVFMPDFSNMILVLEDLNEPLYKIDRMLHQLLLNGIFDNLAALALGDFALDTAEKAAAEQLFARIANNIPCSCFKDFCFGHRQPMHALNAEKLLTIQPL